jgi:hypothetical protein
LPQGSRPKDEVGRMSLLFARSCLAVAAFCARTSFVRDDVEDPIRLADIQAEGIPSSADTIRFSALAFFLARESAIVQ